ncbi:hypothetical protein [Ralstonia syzygii]|uniref:hypothetical protein n=1 Tax=Ralstonia syzygii TaxID=28097 RepID=UPI0018D011F0|nr:hypothetical protein [Ralstonia syzygii]
MSLTADWTFQSCRLARSCGDRLGALTDGGDDLRRANGTKLAKVPAAERGRFGDGRSAGFGVTGTGFGRADDRSVGTGRLAEMGEGGMWQMSERSSTNAIRVGRDSGTRMAG